VLCTRATEDTEIRLLGCSGFQGARMRPAVVVVESVATIPSTGYNLPMPTLVMDPVPAEIDALIERREALGLDHRDEVWQGVLHMIPPPSYRHERVSSNLHRLLGPHADAAGLDLVGIVGIGTKADNRIPDLTFQRANDAQPQWQETAAIVIEIVSPRDKSRDKLDFYAAHKVDEVMIVDPDKRVVEWMGLADGEYKALENSGLIDLGVVQLTQLIDWP
jgi:Uma2 family endonuclease